MPAEGMTAYEIRRWVGSYVLIFTAALGAYFTLAAGTWLLPFEDSEITSAQEIILPFLLGQVVLVYKFFTARRQPRKTLRSIPPFFVKAPLLLASLILLAGFTVAAIGGYQGASWTMSSSQFKALVTFVVALLNSSTVFITARYFEELAVASSREAA